MIFTLDIAFVNEVRSIKERRVAQCFFVANLQICLVFDLIAQLTHALMYATFQLVSPGVLPHADSKYLVLGMDL